ncbi:MAG: TrkA C-terminal domain-containing protein [Candidatus Altiarchaeota archaeon]
MKRKRKIEIFERKVDDIVEEAISEHRSVKDILVEMKDNVELMIDLAYSALLVNSVEIAEEVRSLEERMDELQYEIETRLLLSSRNIKEAEDIAGILHVALSLENIADAADDITDVVRRGAGDHPIYKTIFGETKEQVVKMTISENSKLIGKTIGELQVLKKFGCYIRAIKRGNRWIFTPDKDTCLMKGDLLIVNGGKSEIESFREQL